MLRRGLLKACAIALVCLLAAAPVAGQPVSQDARQRLDDYQIKALFLYNFANFVEWPENAFAGPDTPIRLCLFGEIPFATLLDTVDGTMIGERRLQVHATSAMADIASGCHILFVGEDRRVQLPEFWRQIRYVYVLSVGEQNRFADRGGMINILRTEDRMQFEINLDNALDAGLFLSSDLLALAQRVKRSEDGAEVENSAAEPAQDNK